MFGRCRGNFRPIFMVAAWVVLGLFLSSSRAGAADVAYSRLDLSTVRVFAYSGVGIVDAVSKKTKKKYKMASPMAGHGSGIVVTNDGMVLTAQHVIEDAAHVVVMMPGSRKAYPARVTYQSKKRDVAVISIPGTHENFVALPDAASPLFADRKRPQSSRGAISGLMPDGSLQLSISINPGNSGGPLIDEAENLIGIVIARGDTKKGIEGVGVAVGLDQILAKRESFAKLHEGARKELENASSTSWATASVIAKLVQGQSAIAMIDDAMHSFYGSTPKIAQELDSAIQKDADPTLLSLGCAYHFNAAIVFRDGGADGWQKHALLARKYCARAGQMDPAAGRRSPLIAYVSGGEPQGYRLENTSQSASGTGSGLTATGPGPDTLGKFRLGMSVEQARVLCESHDYTFRAIENRFECNGAPDAPFRGAARLRFREGKLYRIDVVRKLQANRKKEWSDEYDKQRSKLEKAYGKASSIRRELPETCRRRVPECVEKGTAVFEHSWGWGDQGRRLGLALGRYDESPAVVLSLKMEDKR